MMDPLIAVILSFSLFIIIAYRLGYRRSITALDKKIAGIRQTLDEAARAKEAAMQELSQERRRYGEILAEVDLTISHAEEQILSLRHQTLQDLDSLLKKRHQEAERMIDRLHHEAVKRIQEEATAATLATFKALVETGFSPAHHETLNAKSIAKIAAHLTDRPTTAGSRHHKSKRAVVQ